MRRRPTAHRLGTALWLLYDAMVQVFGINYAESFLVKTCLESFFGVGPKHSTRIMARFHIHKLARLGSLKNAQILDINAELGRMKIENDLRREIQENIRRLKDMGSYRGRRHVQGLPVRGQNTRSQITTARKLNRAERGGTGPVRL